VQRGEIWWVDFPAPIGRRPALLLSRNAAYGIRTSVTVAAVTSTVRHNLAEVELGTEDGMTRDCAVNLDEIYTISKIKITDKMTALSDDKMRAVDTAIKYALDLG